MVSAGLERVVVGSSSSFEGVCLGWCAVCAERWAYVGCAVGVVGLLFGFWGGIVDFR